MLLYLSPRSVRRTNHEDPHCAISSRLLLPPT
jgi:hypothetical protein